MQVKRFVANDIQEAMSKVKREMGNDAIILHTRHFKEGGILGMFKKSYVEVTAALETGQPQIATHLNIPQMNSIAPIQLQVQKESRVIDITDRHRRRSSDEIKKTIAQKCKQLEENEDDIKFNRLGQHLFEHLKEQGVDEKISTKVVKSSLQQLAMDSHVPQEQIKEVFFNNLLKPVKNRNKTISHNKAKHSRPKVYAMVGATGVGKTTTIAKLAAMYALMEGKKVAFLTVDTYRIAAVEQLKTIGDIMNVPVSVVYSLNQLESCLNEMFDNDIIFIDTAGRNHKNSLQIEELRKYLEVAKPDEVFLALSCTSKYEDLLNILDVYKEFNITRLVFTKLDETSYYGSIYNIVCKSKYPLAYFTTGQSIPDDIEIADPVKLVHLLMKE